MPQPTNPLFAAALAVAAGLAAIAPGTVHAARNSGWWVVLGSVASPDNNMSPQVEAAVERVEAAARRCGLKPFHDFSSKFGGFTRGYTVVVVGAYASRSAAEGVLAKAKPCVPTAYLRQGSYAGE